VWYTVRIFGLKNGVDESRDREIERTEAVRHRPERNPLHVVGSTRQPYPVLYISFDRNARTQAWFSSTAVKSRVASVIEIHPMRMRQGPRVNYNFLFK
jgi:hypothetical protein